MQWVFFGSAATLFVPVLFHQANTHDVSDIDPAKGRYTEAFADAE